MPKPLVNSRPLMKFLCKMCGIAQDAPIKKMVLVLEIDQEPKLSVDVMLDDVGLLDDFKCPDDSNSTVVDTTTARNNVWRTYSPLREPLADQPMAGSTRTDTMGDFHELTDPDDKPKRLSHAVGLTVFPADRTSPFRYESFKVLDVFPSGHGNIFDPEGVLKIESSTGRALLVPAGQWICNKE